MAINNKVYRFLFAPENNKNCLATVHQEHNNNPGKSMKTTLSLLTKNMRTAFAASAAFSVLAFNTAVAQELGDKAAEPSARRR